MGGFASVVENLLRKATTSLEEKAGPVLDTWIKRGARSVEDIGPRGQMLTGLLKNLKETYRMYFGEYEAAEKPLIEAVSKHRDVAENFYDYFSGAKKHPDPGVQNSVQSYTDFVKASNLSAYGKAAKSGVPVGKPNPDDWSRVWPRSTFEGVNRESSVKTLITQGYAKNEHEASKLLDKLSGQVKGRKSYNLRTSRRVDLPGWRKDIFAPSDAMKDKLWDIASHEILGPKEEILSELLSSIKRENGNASYQLADKYVDVFLRKVGKNYRPYSNAEQSINTLVATRFLGLASVRNVAQPLNTIVFGARMKPLVNTIRELISDYGNAEEWGIRSGVVFSNALKTMRSVFNDDFGRSNPILKWTGFSSVERFNRIFSTTYGKELARDLVQEFDGTKSPYVLKKLAQLGIDAERALERGLTEQELLRAGMRTSDITQFGYSVDQLPIAWRDSPMSRILTQYKPWVYMQSVLLRDEIIKPAITFARTGGRDGAIAPLAYFAMLFPTVGEVIADVYNVATRGDLKDRPEAKYWLDRAIDNISYVGGFGILNDLVYSLSSPDRLTQVPLASMIADLIRISMSKDPLKTATRQIPTVGPILSRQMKPRKRLKAHGFQGYLQEGELTKGLYKILRAGTP